MVGLEFDVQLSGERLGIWIKPIRAERLRWVVDASFDGGYGIIFEVSEGRTPRETRCLARAGLKRRFLADYKMDI